MATHRIRLLELGRWDWAPGFEMFWMEPHAPDGPLSLVAMVIESDHGRVMVNTGPDPGMLDELNATWAGFDPRHQLRIHDGQGLDDALGSIGLTPADIDHVVITPFQPYAIGNLLRFERATVGLSRTGWIDFHAPRWRVHPHDHRPFCIPRPVLTELVGDSWDRTRLLADEDEVVPGVTVFWTGSHHRSSMAVRVETADGVVVASDCFFRYENVTENRPLGINESLAETLTAYERIRTEADVLVPLYDGRVFERHPDGIGWR